MGSPTDHPDAGPPERLAAVADLVEIAGRLPGSSVAVAGGHRPEDLRLVESARDHGIVDRVILVGWGDRIAAAVEEVGIEIDSKDIVPADDHEQAAAATAELIRGGEVDIVLKGDIPTPVINRHMLPLAIRPTVSLATVFDAAPIGAGRPMVLTDAGVTTVCSFGRLADLLRNAVDVARVALGVDRPRVAILSANEKQIPSLPSTWLAAKLAERDWPDAVVCGPLSLDLATDPGSVAIKGLPDMPGAKQVAGRADVLLCPCIDAANILYKTISALAKYGQASLASVTVGFPVPYVILSRSDSLQTRLESIALCAVYTRRARAGGSARPRGATAPSGKTYRVLAVNPGSTSVKIAVYAGAECLQAVEQAHEIPAAPPPAERAEQVEHLTDLVLGTLRQWGETGIDAVSARGGFFPRPEGKLPGGTYVVAERRDDGIVVDDAMVSAVLDRPEAEHASNFGAPVAAALARKLGAWAFVVDPVVVDEFTAEAEVSGYAPIVRKSTSHALSVHAAARRAAEATGRAVEDVNLVVAHLGGGITVAAVRGGRMVDNNIALLGGGPFTPRRAGQLPAGELIDLCYSGRVSRAELVAELTQRGGLRSYLGTHDMREIEARIDAGDERARLAVDAMIYQVAKEIGKAFVAAGGDVEAIVLTGGLTRSQRVCTGLRRRVSRLAPVTVFEGSLEMAALAAGAVEVLAGRADPRRYTPPEV